MVFTLIFFLVLGWIDGAKMGAGIGFVGSCVGFFLWIFLMEAEMMFKNFLKQHGMETP